MKTRFLWPLMGLMLVTTPGHAAVYDFSFSNDGGATAGTVTGSIVLPDGDGTFAALSILVESAPVALGHTIPMDVVSWSTIVQNSFTVAGGNINALSSSFFSINGSSGVFALNGFVPYGSLLNVKGVTPPFEGVYDHDSSTLSYSAFSPVPEPSTALASLAGLLALGLMRRQKA